MKQVSFTFDAADEQATDRFGAVLARALPDGTVVALRGTLGAGKTRLVRAVAMACGVPGRSISSPTFTLMHEYEGDRTLYHLDAYRMENELEFLDLGPDELYASQAIILIEWADRIRGCLPEDYLDIEIEVTGMTTRQFHVVAVGSRFTSVVARLDSELSG